MQEAMHMQVLGDNSLLAEELDRVQHTGRLEVLTKYQQSMCQSTRECLIAIGHLRLDQWSM